MPIYPVNFAHSVCDEFLRYLFVAFPPLEKTRGQFLPIIA